MGSKYIADKLDRSIDTIHVKARNLGLKIDKSEMSKRRSISAKKQFSNPKHPSKYNVNPLQFMNNFNKESVYILGLLWADGTLHKGGRNNYLRIEILHTDALIIFPIFLKTGKWGMNSRQRNNWKKVSAIGTSNRTLVDFLLTMDYGPNNKSSADKILSIIPDNLKHYWFRGLIDGDGCFFVNLNKRQKMFNVSSVYDQNWKYLKTLLDNLNIKYSEYQKFGIKGSCSGITITNYDGIVKIGDYIYQGYGQDRIGLGRKYDKYMTIKTKLVPQ